MSYKLASYISLVFIGLINIFYLIGAISIADHDSGREFGPAFYPLILSIILFILLIMSFIKTYMNKNKEGIHFNFIVGLKKVALIIIPIVIFLILWTYFDYFYILSFFLLMSLFIINKPSILRNKKELSVYFLIAIGYLLILYLFFNVLLSFNL